MRKTSTIIITGLLAVILLTQTEFTVTVHKQNDGFIASVSRLVSGATGAYRSVVGFVD